MALVLLLTQCKKPEVKFPSPVAPEGTTVSMTITAGPGRTDITNKGHIVWGEDDVIYVGQGGQCIGYLSITDGVGEVTGTFTGDVTVSSAGAFTFHFFYLGHDNGIDPAEMNGKSSAAVSFASQNITADGSGNLTNASRHHVGYGKVENVVVTGGPLTGLDVTLRSKVAIAYFKFTKDETPYTGALTLSGDHIYNSMTVDFDGNFSGSTTGGIELANTSSNLKYAMLVPTANGSETLNFTGSATATGTVTFTSGIEANKFYCVGEGEPIEVKVTAPTHEYVDLGLSVKWATCNLGAEHPYDYGDYYALGEILPYYADGHSQDNPCSTSDWRDMTTGAGNTDITNGYAWETYSQGGSSSFVEWTAKPYGSDKILTSARDAATKNWGGSWRMPTEAEFIELMNNTNRSWTEENGVDGWKFANKLDATKYIFLPAAGYRDGTSLNDAGSYGYYWSSLLDPIVSPSYGYSLVFTSSNVGVSHKYNRRLGFAVRPVCRPQN